MRLKIWISIEDYLILNNNLFISTGAFQEDEIESIMNSCLANGINRIELSSGIKYTSHLLESIFKGKHDIQFLIHNYFPPPRTPFVLNLASTDEETLQKSRQHCKEAVDLCVQVNSPFYSVHSGFALNLKPKLLGKPHAQSRLLKEAIIPYDIAYSTFLESVVQINDYAKEKGVGLLIENNVVTSMHVDKGKKDAFLMVRCEEIKKLMNEINSSNFGLLVDVGHLKVSANALGYDRAEFLDEVKPYIRAFHLSDNDGKTDQNLQVRKDSWFLPYLNKFPDAVLILEANDLSVDEIKQQLELLSHQLN